jgi:hypothetical protein
MLFFPVPELEERSLEQVVNFSARRGSRVGLRNSFAGFTSHYGCPNRQPQRWQDRLARLADHDARGIAAILQRVVRLGIRETGVIHR